jgi:hypothetical protein
MASSQEPKIIVDDDWKAQAQAEKDRMAEEESAKKADPAEGELPEASFEELVRLMATQALMYMGAFPDPQTGKAMIGLDLAKLHIDMLGVLHDKTKGNLTEHEDKMLTQTLAQLRMEYVELVKVVNQAVAEGRMAPAGSSGPVTEATDPGPPKG